MALGESLVPSFHCSNELLALESFRSSLTLFDFLIFLKFQEITKFVLTELLSCE